MVLRDSQFFETDRTTEFYTGIEIYVYVHADCGLINSSHWKKKLLRFLFSSVKKHKKVFNLVRDICNKYQSS